MLCLCVAAVMALVPSDTVCAPATDTLLVARPPVVVPDSMAMARSDTVVAAQWMRLAQPADTGRKRPRAVSYSDWYSRRVTIHRRTSWAMLPLFAASYYTGNRLAENGRRNSPGWVRQLHPVAAGGSAAVFGVNAVTGVWNLWEGRRDANGRTRRLIHSALFIAASAGFVYAGSLGEEAGDNGEVRTRHRNIALASMSASTLSWLIMLIGN